MESYKASGECGGGMYYWCSDLVIVRDVAPTTIEACVEAMIASDELRQAFKRLSDDWQRLPYGS